VVVLPETVAQFSACPGSPFRLADNAAAQSRLALADLNGIKCLDIVTGNQ
jgi:hypothetical protein